MAKNLVIVESPAKAKTIEKFLGKDFQVESSFGHIADLPSKELGVDVEGDFKPKYIVSSDKKNLVKNLKTLADKAETIWLASDEDREGEAIAWHLAEVLKIDNEKIKRIVFHEITKSAILKAIDNPRGINYNLVNAQQARRVLDRLVGYELSPILWKKIKSGLSAGRVQSVAVRLIVEREREIQNFNSEPYFRVDAEFLNEAGKPFKAKLSKNIGTVKQAEEFLEKNNGAAFHISSLETKPVKKFPAPPFTTSTLQQEASRKLSFPVAKTMTVAQRLYEAGLITYMRTDSVNLSQEAINAAKAEISREFGEKYSHPRNFTSKTKGAQEAHEAIRPTDISVHSVSLDRDQARLYELIWQRTIASQMSEAELERTQVHISASTHNETFVATGEMIKFDGFLKVYLESHDAEDEEQEGMLPLLRNTETLTNNYITATERFTRPPYRYTEASLVKKLEDLGIGRPSTYAPTISTIQQREYVVKGSVEGEKRKYIQLTFKNGNIDTKQLTENVGSDKGKLVPTDIGMIVNDFLVENFTTILDYNFTAKMEQDFDDIAEGNEKWTEMMREFYNDFHPQVKNVEKNAERESGERILGPHPETGKTVLVRLGKFGAMAQIGSQEDSEKQFASLRPDQQLSSITLEEALDLFKLPKKIGTYEQEELEANNGRFGPYLRFGKQFISLPKGTNPLDVTMEMAVELINQKKKADAPIAEYQGKPVQKGVGRFGPFIKWNNMYINVSKKYDFNALTTEDVEELIEDKLKKEQDKLIREWKDEGIRIEKAKWGRHVLIKGKQKVELAKGQDPETITLEVAKTLLENSSGSKKTTKSKSVKK